MKKTNPSKEEWIAEQHRRFEAIKKRYEEADVDFSSLRVAIARHSTVTNPVKFFEHHMTLIEAQWGKRFVRPYVRGLLQILQILEK